MVPCNDGCLPSPSLRVFSDGVSGGDRGSKMGVEPNIGGFLHPQKWMVKISMEKPMNKWIQMGGYHFFLSKIDLPILNLWPS